MGDCYILEDGLIVKIFSSHCMDAGGVEYNGWGSLNKCKLGMVNLRDFKGLMDKNGIDRSYR